MYPQSLEKWTLEGSSEIKIPKKCKKEQWWPTFYNRTVRVKHQCRKTTVLSWHRCLINTGVKNELHLNIDYNFKHKMSLSRSKCWYSNNCLYFLNVLVPL